MVKERFKAVYAQRKAISEEMGNIKPLVSLVHEFAEKIIEGDNTALSCIKKIQRDLYKKGTLPFEVNSMHDLAKVKKLSSGDICDFLTYVCLAYRRDAEDWYWHEELQEYVSRNGFWDTIRV